MNIRCLGTLLLAAATGHAAAAVKPGHLDESFGFGGRQTMPVDMLSFGEENSVTSLIGPEGKIYIVGSSRTQEGITAMTILRMESDGAIDTGFGEQGAVVHLPQGVSSVVLKSATFDAEGRLVVAGTAVVQTKILMIACRFTSEGAPDSDFGTDTVPSCYTLPLEGGVASSVIVQNGTGRVILAGSVMSAGQRLGTVLGLLPDGTSYAPDFGVGLGLNFLYPHHPTDLLDIAQNSQGELAATGFRLLDSPDADFIVVRLDASGQKQDGSGSMPEFGSNGTAALLFDYFYSVNEHGMDKPTAIKLLDDGSLFVTGFGQTGKFMYRPIVVKMTATGDVDGNFSYNQALTSEDLQAYDLCEGVCDMRAQDIAVLSNGSVVVTGTIRQGNEFDTAQTLHGQGDFFALRLSSTGVPDPTFRSVDSNYDGLSIIPFDAYSEPPEDSAFSLTQQGDRLLIAGWARTDNTPNDAVPDLSAAIARIGNGEQTFSDGFE